MSDLFVTHPINRHPNEKQQKCYVKAQSQFLSHHFGYYSIRFIEMIAKDASDKVDKIEVLSIDKLLREATRKFLLTDLQLVYLGHSADILEWNIKDPFLKQNCQIMNFPAQHMHPQSTQLWLLINLVGWFVKKYIGKLEECTAIQAIMQQQTNNQWQYLYQQWLSTCPEDMFRLSPRSINLRYTRYTQNCQDVSSTKNYNKMVDQIMELSTSYAMIAGQSKENKKKKDQQLPQPEEPSMIGRKIMKRDSLGFSNQGNTSKLFDFNNNHSSFQQSNSFLEQKSSIKPKREVKLGFKNSQQSKVNQHVTDLYNNASDLSVSNNRRYAPQSTYGVIMNSNVNFFDSKIFSSGQDIIPYTLRSNSGIFKSKLFQ